MGIFMFVVFFGMVLLLKMGFNEIVEVGRCRVIMLGLGLEFCSVRLLFRVVFFRRLFWMMYVVIDGLNLLKEVVLKLFLVILGVWMLIWCGMVGVEGVFFILISGVFVFVVFVIFLLLY